MSRGRFALFACVALHVFIFGAGFFGPYDPEAQFRDAPFALPARLHFYDGNGRLTMRPYVHQPPFATGAGTGEQAFPVQFFVSGPHFFGVPEPGHVFLLGTDANGRDQFSRLLAGGRVSLLAGFAAAFVALLIGVIVGGAAGFLGGWWDEILMRATELLMALPWIYLLLAFRAFLPLHLSSSLAFLAICSAIGLLGWARPARLVRGVILMGREQAFVIASRGTGATEVQVFFWHVLPQTRDVLIAQATLLIPQFVLASVILSFLGLGIDEPHPSWGSMLASLREVAVIGDHWWMGLPAVLLMFLFASYYSFSEMLNLRESNCK